MISKSASPGAAVPDWIGSPFSPDQPAAYERWRDAKLKNFPSGSGELLVEIQDPAAITVAERERLVAACRRANMVIYTIAGAPNTLKDIPRLVGAQLGLTRFDSNMLADDDAISSIEVVPGKSGRGYIPYSNRRLLWHTDGYYNSPDRRIRAFILHCASAAEQGGENELLDPEVAYIELRERSVDHIRALMAPDAMTIPANDEAGGIRAAQAGPVFSIEPDSGSLHMRYTARTRSIQWKDDDATRAAVSALESLLSGRSPYVFRHRLETGQGLLCNNVLHNRSEFTDAVDSGTKRLIYRARYYDRVAGTGLRHSAG